MKLSISQAPIQARADTESKLERYLSIKIANVYNDLLQNVLNDEINKIDFWNTYCQKIDLQISAQQTNENEYLENTLGARYSNLKSYFNIDFDGRKLLLDSEEKVKDIILEFIQLLIKRELAFIGKIELQTCKSCKTPIATQNVNIIKCKNCGGINFELVKSEQMLLDVEKLFEINAEKINEIFANKPWIKSFFNTLPRHQIISKKRFRGISVETFGLSEQLKIDPKIILALQSLLYSEIYGTELIGVVQGIDSIKNTFPLSVILDPTFKAKIISVPMIPELKNSGIK
ncbi:hypothetical protein GF376_00070, partial [Candidatus Peregrinibacteria bacterium]|nr:hypothetical protein [Candidatus Peregrinibacteria bacterium]